jgi:hypothetical protein
MSQGSDAVSGSLPVVLAQELGCSGPFFNLDCNKLPPFSWHRPSRKVCNLIQKLRGNK